jgi:hypothetical protein
VHPPGRVALHHDPRTPACSPICHGARRGELDVELGGLPEVALARVAKRMSERMRATRNVRVAFRSRVVSHDVPDALVEPSA